MNETIYHEILERLGLALHEARLEPQAEAQARSTDIAAAYADTGASQAGIEEIDARDETPASQSAPHDSPSGSATTWPEIITGLGVRHNGAFDPCARCGIGSWVRYGRMILCRPCAQYYAEQALISMPAFRSRPRHEDDANLPHGETCDCSSCIPDTAPE